MNFSIGDFSRKGLEARWGEGRPGTKTIRVWADVADLLSKVAGEKGDRVKLASEAIIQKYKK